MMNLRFRWLFRRDEIQRFYRICRVCWERGTPGQPGGGYSAKLSAAWDWRLFRLPKSDAGSDWREAALVREKTAALGLLEGHALVIKEVEARAIAAEAQVAALREALMRFADFKNCTAADVYRARELTGMLHLNETDNCAAPPTKPDQGDAT